MNLIVAVAKNGVIGKDNKLPWHLPEDLKHFKNITTGHVVVMGRKTYESLPNGALPFRKNIVLTRDENYLLDDAEVMNAIEEVLAFQELHPDEEIYIMGGAEIYKAFMPYVKRLCITCVALEVEGDSFFPTEFEGFTLSYLSENMTSKNGIEYMFSELTRNEVTA